MPSRSPAALRTLVIALAVVVYALPAGLDTVSALSHAVSHLVAEAADQRRVMGSMGLTHGTPETAAAKRLPLLPRSSQPRSIVHTHGGTTHAHGGVVATLISGSDETEGQMTAAHTAVTVAVHLPAPHAPSVTHFAPAHASAWTWSRAIPGPTLAPQPQPPRV